MAGLKIDADELAKTINDILDDFGESTRENLDKASWQTAGDVVKELKKGGDYKGGNEYNKSWARVKITKRLYTQVIVYNKSRLNLSSWLEFGHAKQNGGRTKAYPHIAPVNDKVGDYFMDNFEDAMKQI